MQRTQIVRGSAAVLVAAALLAPPAFAKELFTLRDARGDDHGDGNFVYPLNEELDPGDLDLLSLSARAGNGGTWFDAVFARPIRVPEAEVIDDLGTSLKSVARLGFYTFNLDVYIDTDRVADSGGFKTLPGRLAQIDRASAWERAVVLTPRPHEARGELKRMLARDLNQTLREGAGPMGDAEAAELRSQIPGDVESRIFFPNQVRVRGTKVSFFVPQSFLGGPAKDTWSYVVAVSGADVLQAFDLNRVLGRGSKDEGEESLMILPISPGKWQDRFGGGRENAPNQPPLVDILVPAGKRQEDVLRDFDARAGRPVVLPGVVPSEQK